MATSLNGNEGSEKPKQDSYYKFAYENDYETGSETEKSPPETPAIDYEEQKDETDRNEFKEKFKKFLKTERLKGRDDDKSEDYILSPIGSNTKENETVLTKETMLDCMELFNDEKLKDAEVKRKSDSLEKNPSPQKEEDESQLFKDLVCLERDQKILETNVHSCLKKLGTEMIEMNLENYHPEKINQSIKHARETLQQWVDVKNKLIEIYKKLSMSDRVSHDEEEVTAVIRRSSRIIRDTKRTMLDWEEKRFDNTVSDFFSSVSDDVGQFVTMHGSKLEPSKQVPVVPQPGQNYESSFAKQLESLSISDKQQKVERDKSKDNEKIKRQSTQEEVMRTSSPSQMHGGRNLVNFAPQEPNNYEENMFRHYADQAQCQGGRVYSDFPQNQDYRRSQENFQLSRPEYGRKADLKLKSPTLKAGATIKQFYHFKEAFYSLMKMQKFDDESKLFLLQDAVEDEELKSVIMSFPYTARGFERAFRSLQNRFGNEGSLKLNIFADLEKISVDSRTSKGLFELSTIINSITVDPAFRLETGPNSLLFNKIYSKLPRNILDRFEDRYRDEINLHTLGEFVEDLAIQRKDDQYRRGAFVQETKPKGRTYFSRNYSSETKSKPYNRRKDWKCNICNNKDHFADKCPKLNTSYENRIQVVRRAKLCFNCLGRHHIRECFNKRRCSVCKEKHNTVLHKPTSKAIEFSDIKREAESHSIIENQSDDCSEELLPVKYSAIIIPVTAYNSSGENVETLAYHDNGSDETWVTPEFARSLGLQPIASGGDLNVKTVMGSKTYKNTDIVEFSVSGIGDKTSIPMTCRIMHNVPQCKYQDVHKLKRKHEFLKKVPLKGSKARKVGMIIGRDCPDLLELEDKVKGSKSEPRAYKYRLGWAVCVPKGTAEIDSHCITSGDPEEWLRPEVSLGEFEKPEVSLDETAHDAMHKMLKDENFIIEEKPAFTKDEELAYEFVRKMFTFEEGRPETAIPFNEKEELLENNFSVAIKRLESTMTKLMKTDTCLEFDEKIQDAIDKDYIEEVFDEEPHIGKKTYLPVSIVIRKDRETNKLRPCMDASAQFKGKSLNKAIRTGPNMQEDMIQVLIGFMKEETAISLDVSEMFPQVSVRKEDRDRLRFIVRRHGEEKIRIYRHKRVPFGLSCSPFLAQYTVLRTAEEMKDELPLAHEMITKHRSVDDVTSSLESKEKAKQALKEVPTVFKACGMEVHKVLSNDPEVLETVQEDKRLKGWKKGETLPSTKVLGLNWNPTTDLNVPKQRDLC